jgi:hypothetical protein
MPERVISVEIKGLETAAECHGLRDKAESLLGGRAFVTAWRPEESRCVIWVRRRG